MAMAVFTDYWYTLQQVAVAVSMVRDADGCRPEAVVAAIEVNEVENAASRVLKKTQNYAKNR